MVLLPAVPSRPDRKCARRLVRLVPRVPSCVPVVLLSCVLVWMNTRRQCLSSCPDLVLRLRSLCAVRSVLTCVNRCGLSRTLLWRVVSPGVHLVLTVRTVLSARVLSRRKKIPEMWASVLLACLSVMTAPLRSVGLESVVTVLILVCRCCTVLLKVGVKRLLWMWLKGGVLKVSGSGLRKGPVTLMDGVASVLVTGGVDLGGAEWE